MIWTYPTFIWRPIEVTPLERRRDFWRQKTRVPVLSNGVVCVILGLAVLVELEHRLVTDGRTDGWTDTRWRLASVALVKTTCPNFVKVSAHVVCGSIFLWQQCSTLCTSGFVDDVMVSHNGPYGAQRWQYQCVTVWSRAAASSHKFPTYSPWGATLVDFVVVCSGSKLPTREKVWLTLYYLCTIGSLQFATSYCSLIERVALTVRCPWDMTSFRTSLIYAQLIGPCHAFWLFSLSCGEMQAATPKIWY